MKASSRESQPPPLTLGTQVRQELQPARLVPTLTAGLITGVLLVIYAISMAALIFTGPLAEFISVGIGLTLFAAIVTAVVVALTNSMPGIVTMPQDSLAIILAIMAGAIAAQLPASDAALLPTVVMGLAIATGIVGIVCFLIGSFKLGNLIRFIPYPVVGGFLAGTGYLLAQGAFNVMTDQFFNLANLPALLAPAMAVRWLPGCATGLALVLLLRRYHSVFILPGVIVGGTLVFYLTLWLTQTPISSAQNLGLLFGAFPEGGLWQPLHWSMLTQVNWALILGQVDKIATIVLLSVIALLLNVSGIELAARQDIDLNQELRSAGIANVLVGLGGGIVSFHSLGLSVLSCAKINAKSRLVGILAAIICLITLLMGETLVTLFPKPMLGGIALFLGLSFLVEWVYDAWFKLPKTDYGIVILILCVIATLGFLQGVGVGLAVAIALFVISASRVNVTKYTLSGATHQSHTARSLPQTRILQEEGEQIYILDLQGFLFFGTTSTLLNRIQERLHDARLQPLKYVVLNFQAVNGLDSSAVLSFVKLKQLLQQQDIKLVLTHLSLAIRTQLKRGDCLLPDDPVCQVFPDLDRGLEWCENDLLGVVPLRRARTLPLLLQLNTLFPQRDVAAEFFDYLEEWDAEPGEYVYQHGQPADAIDLIEVGEVTVYLGRQQEQTHRIQALGAGNVVGAVDFFRHSTHQTTAIVEAPSTLYRLTTERFQHLEQEHPEVATAFQAAVIQILGDRLTYAYKEIADLLRS
ncbi:MAG: SulP family inorganic anion transporter [Nodosilinea sp.]